MGTAQGPPSLSVPMAAELTATADVPGIPFSSLPTATSFPALLSHPLVRASLEQHGIAVIRSFGPAVFPRLSALASRLAGAELLTFLDALDPSIGRKTVRMNRFTYHRASVDAARPCLVLDRACATDTEAQTFRSAYARGGPSIDPLDPAWSWDHLVKNVLPGHLLLYGSDVHNVSLLGYERRAGGTLASGSGSGSGGGGGSGGIAAASGDTGLHRLDMTRLTPSDCLYRALMAADGLKWPGMSTCYTYFGRAHAVFAAHAEDHNLPSINQLVFGAPKVWYAVPGKHFRAAADALRAAVPRGELPQCAQALAHKLMLPSLAVLKAAGLPVHRLVHWPGDLVITAPGAVHWGINCGANVAESTNVADGAWLTDGGAYKAFMAQGPCTCRDKNPWGLIPRVWLPRGFLEGRLLGPFKGGEEEGSGSGGSGSGAAGTTPHHAATGKKRAAAAATGGSTPRPAKRLLLAQALAAAAAAASPLPTTGEPPQGSIAAAFRVPLGVFSPPEGAGGGDGAGAGAAATQSGKPPQAQSFAWYVAEVLEHRTWGKRGTLQFRVRWVGLRKTHRRHKRWHSIDIFKTEGAEGRVPGEVSCTLIDAKIGKYCEERGLNK